MSKWVDDRSNAHVGDVGFLLNISNATTGADRYELCDTPAHTNVSHMPRLHGWCGTYNDTATFAKGVARVAKVARNGRVKVEPLTGQDLADALEELGHPELLSDEGELK